MDTRHGGSRTGRTDLHRTNIIPAKVAGEVQVVPTLNAAGLFTVWERGLSQAPVQRALMLLAMAWPERSVDEWAQTIIGERDEHLLRLRDEVFGSKVEAITACAACGERLAISFTTESMRAKPAQPKVKDSRFALKADGFEVSYRLPNSADLIAVLESDQSDNRNILLKRCVDASKKNKSIDPARLPERIVQLISESMSDADPQADLRIELKCPACRHERSIVFDILSYLWSEIDDWARRLLNEIHVLASSYGWSEAEIISLSARRRNLYMQMIEA